MISKDFIENGKYVTWQKSETITIVDGKKLKVYYKGHKLLYLKGKKCKRKQ